MLRVWVVVALGGCLSTPTRPADPVSDVSSGFLAAGRHHACAIDDAKRLFCWGDNRAGQLGIDPATLRFTGTPMQIPGAWTAVAAGRAHTCALAEDGTVSCWGANDVGQSGKPASPKPIAPTVIDGVTSADFKPKKLFAGGDATCVTTATAHLYCWGHYDASESAGHEATQVVPGGGHNTWFEVALSTTHACAGNDFNDTYCWGTSQRHELGEESGVDRPLASANLISQRMVQIAVGVNRSCGIGTGGELYCWGHSSLTGTPNDAPEVVRIGARENHVEVAIGAEHACTIADAKLYCWGPTTRGALGNGNVGDADVPPAMPVFTNVTAVVGGDGFTCARDAAHAITCWGSNQFGELGTGVVAGQHTPFEVPLGGPALSVAAGARHTCAVLTTGEVKCWGDNRDRQSAAVSMNYVTSPVSSGRTITTISSRRLLALGFSHSCAFLNNYGIACWGANGLGELGPQVSVISADDVMTGNNDEWAELAVGASSTCAMTLSGVSFCWGELGGTGGAPKLLAPAVKYGAVAIGNGVAVGARDISTDNAVEQFGPPGFSCLPSSSPTVALPHVASHITRLPQASTGGEGHVCALDNDNVSATLLYCWGYNGSHQIDTSASSCVMPAPLTLPGSRKVQWYNGASRPATLAVGGDHTCVLTENEHDVYCWGNNEDSSLGSQNDDVDVVATPHLALPPDPTDPWLEIATGAHHTCVVSDASHGGKVYCWGLNEFGEVGNGERFLDVPPTSPIVFP